MYVHHSRHHVREIRLLVAQLEVMDQLSMWDISAYLVWVEIRGFGPGVVQVLLGQLLDQ